MDNIIEKKEKNDIEKEQENLKIENFKPLNNKNDNDESSKPLSMINKKFTLKKSASYVAPNYSDKMNLQENEKIYMDLNITNKTSSVNSSYLFNNKINFTTLNEGNSIFLSNKEKNIEKENNKNNNKSISQLYSKNFADLIKSNDFQIDLGKYDNKIIITLNKKVQELEDKLMKALTYYYQMENKYISELKRKGDTEHKLNLSIKEVNIYKQNYEKKIEKNMELNNALFNSRNELDRLNQNVREEQSKKLKQKKELDDKLIEEEKMRNKLRSQIKINDRQIAILEEKLNDSKLTHTMKLEKFKERQKLEQTLQKMEILQQKNDEISKIKNNISELQKEADNLEKELKKGREEKNKLIKEIKAKKRKEKFNNDNLNLLYKTLEKQKEEDKINFNLMKSKNMIIKNMNDRANGFLIIPHYSLQKNIRINSATKTSNLQNFFDL